MGIDEVAIIGGGPAGLSAAIQLKRSGIEPILFEKEMIGGLLRNANLVENYPGFPQGISGRELVELFKHQLERYDIKTYDEEVIHLAYKDGEFLISTNKRELIFRTVIIASGTRPRRLEELERREVREYVFYEVYSISDIKNERIAIIGAGDIAFDYALTLSKNNEVLILSRSPGARCLPLLFERAMKNENITYFQNTVVENVKAQDTLILNCRNKNGERWNVPVSYLVIAIGRKPALYFLDNEMEIEELQKMGRLYLIGDVKNDIYRQVGIAVGDGLRAAMEIVRRMKGGEAG